MSETPEWSSERQITVSQRLPQNPDMNIIENLWRLMNIYFSQKQLPESIARAHYDN